MMSSKNKPVKIYVTDYKKSRINPDSIRVYKQYQRSKTAINRSVSTNTYKTYESYFYMFMVFLYDNYDNIYILDETLVTTGMMIEVMNSFIDFLQKDMKNKSSAIKVKISAISSFYNWAVKRRKIKKHPFVGRLDKIEDRQKESRYTKTYELSEKEIHKMKEVLSNSNTTFSQYDKIDEVIFNIAYDSACHVTALANLTLDSLDLDNKRFKNIVESQSDVIDVTFSEKTAKIIEDYLEVRELIGVDNNELFYVKSGNKWKGMSKETIYYRIEKIGYIIGINNLKPNDIREYRLKMFYQENPEYSRKYKMIEKNKEKLEEEYGIEEKNDE